MHKQTWIRWLAALVLAFSLAARAAARPVGEEPFSLYGYLVGFGNVMRDHDFGADIYLRLKGEWKPLEKLLFHVEVSNNYTMGNMNPQALFAAMGLAPVDPAEFPFHNFREELVLDHYWASATLKRFNLRFGKIPIAWGTAYAFNPTAKASVPPFLNMVYEETRGTPALALDYGLNEKLSLQAYVALEGRLPEYSVSMESGKKENIPFGVKIRATLGRFDVSLSGIRDVFARHGGYGRNCYLGADFVGTIGGFGVYGEATLNLAGDYPRHRLDFALGGDCTLPGSDVVLRLEYFHQGNGVQNKADYDFTRLISGEFLVIARDYLFLGAEKEFSPYCRLGVSAIINLNDGSHVIYPEFTWSPYFDFSISLGALLLSGSGGSEFNGAYPLGDSQYDVLGSSFFLKCKLSF